MRGSKINILALDFGSHVGWACRINGTLESGVEHFVLSRGESAGMRFVRFSEWLRTMIECCQNSPELCVYEKAHFRGGFATDVLVGMVTRLEEVCAENRIEYVGVHSGTLKKWATGSGRAEKKAMMAAAQKRYPDVELISDDHADALLLLGHAEEKFDSQMPAKKYIKIKDIRERGKKQIYSKDAVARLTR